MQFKTAVLLKTKQKMISTFVFLKSGLCVYMFYFQLKVKKSLRLSDPKPLVD